jgi:hypothetical protein
MDPRYSFDARSSSISNPSIMALKVLTRALVMVLYSEMSVPKDTKMVWAYAHKTTASKAMKIVRFAAAWEIVLINCSACRILKPHKPKRRNFGKSVP